MTLEQLRELNPEIQFYGVDDADFAEFGRRITDVAGYHRSKLRSKVLIQRKKG